MKRFFILAAGVACVALAVRVFRWAVTRPSSSSVHPEEGLQGLSLAVFLLVAGGGLIAWGCSRYVYRAKEGKVIAHSYTPARTVAAHTELRSMPALPSTDNQPVAQPTYSMVYVPEQHFPARWSLQIEDDRGHTAWMHFGANVLAEYPVGSYYPRPDTPLADEWPQLPDEPKEFR